LQENPRPTHRVIASVRSLVHRFIYLGLVVAAFALMLLGKADALIMERFRTQVTDAFAPILGALSRPAATVSRLVARAEDMAAIYSDNERLREENTRLLQWQAAARRLAAENTVLKELLNFAPDAEVSFITARVIADTGGAFAHSLLLAAGPQDGVRKGQAVVTGGGLIGRVADVGGRSVRVLLITDLNSRIPVTVEATRTRAILAGNNTGRPRLIHLTPGATVSAGERIVTSGHGGAFPPGLPMGVIASVSDGGILVRPHVSRESLEFVRIVDFGLPGAAEKGAATSRRGSRRAGP